MQPLGGGCARPRVLHPLRTHLKLDIDAEKVLIFTSCGPEKPNRRADDSVMELKLKCDGCNACVYLALIASRFAITVDLEGHKVGPDFFQYFYMEQAGKIWRIAGIKSFKGEGGNLKLDASVDGQPVKFFQNGGTRIKNQYIVCL